MDIWKYNISSQPGRPSVPFQGASTRTLASAAYTGNNNILIFGGENNGSDNGYNGLWDYNLSAVTWSQINDVPGIFAVSKIGLKSIRVGNSKGSSMLKLIKK